MHRRIYGGCFGLWVLHEAVSPTISKSAAHKHSNTLIGVSMLLFAIIVTVLYLYTENAVHHQVATAIIVWYSVFD